MDTGLPTPRTTLAASYVMVLVWCKSCRHQAQADMQKLIDTGMGDVPLTRLRFRCSNCGSSLTDFVVHRASHLPRRHSLMPGNRG